MDDNLEGKIIVNPINKLIVGMFTIISCVTFFLAILYYDAGNTSFSIVLLLVGLGMLFFMYFLQIYRKPSEIEITREGFVLKFRHSKPIFVRYGEVKWITSLKKGDVGCGTIGVIGRFQYDLEHGVCVDLRSAYVFYTGERPKDFP